MKRLKSADAKNNLKISDVGNSFKKLHWWWGKEWKSANAENNQKIAGVGNS